MIREGQGKAPPAQIAVTIPHHRYIHLRDLALQREQQRRYSSSSRVWCRGLCQRPTFTGLIGEEAFSQFINAKLAKQGVRIAVDEQARANGDGGIDFTVLGVGIQLKTRQRREVVLVRRQDENGTLLPIVWQVLVSATWKDAGDEEPNHTVFLDGWVSRKNLRVKGKFLPARRGDHMNLELPDEELDPMTRIVTYFQNRVKG
jgi:hypothetical protein